MLRAAPTPSSGAGYLLRSGSHLATLGCAFALTACQFPLSSLIPLFHRRFQPHLHQIRSKGPSAIRLATLCSSVRNAECFRNACSDRRLSRPYNVHTSACGLDILLRSDFHPLVFRAVRARIGFVFEVDSAPGGRAWPRLALRTGDPITSINRSHRWSRHHQVFDRPPINVLPPSAPFVLNSPIYAGIGNSSSQGQGMPIFRSEKFTVIQRDSLAPRRRIIPTEKAWILVADQASSQSAALISQKCKANPIPRMRFKRRE